MKISTKSVLIGFFCGLVSIFFTSAASGQNMFRKINDFDGDGRADFAITRNIDGLKFWYIWQSTAGFRVSQWGISTDYNVSGDYDGDGKYEPAVFRKWITPSNAQLSAFWVLGSQMGVLSLDTGHTFSLNYPLVQDYNGDGKTDFARTLYPDNTRLNIDFLGVTVGDAHINQPGIFGKIGDMTGDGKADVFTFNPTNNLATIKTYGTDTRNTIQFGAAGDDFTAADFDGDAKGDLTVFRQTDGTWWRLRSSDNVINAATFGAPGDVAVPADYDGDGKTDLAIWRSSAQSYFWVYGSQSGIFALPWGVSGDTVVRY